MAAALVEKDELGNLFYNDTARLNLGLYQSDINVVIDLAPHDVSIINHVLGRRPTAAEDVAYLRSTTRTRGCPRTSTSAGSTRASFAEAGASVVSRR